MNSKIEKQRNKLRAEIIVAKQRLHYNFSNMEIEDYFGGGGKKVAARAAFSMMELNPEDVIMKLNSLSNQFLDQKSTIRKVLNWLSMIVKGKNVLESLRK